MIKITEQESLYRHLEKMSTKELLTNINTEDKKVAFAVEKSIPQIEILVNAIFEKMNKGGRLFYVGAGTSGRLGILDASEIPPTFGASYDLFVGLIAGGDKAIRRAMENAEDDINQVQKDLEKHNIDSDDFIIGLSASGTTPYVVQAMKYAEQNGIKTGCITNNHDSPLAENSDYPVEIIVGPEFVTGSSRMKSGTAQKMVLNMISTSLMIKLGNIQDNRMVDMKISNEKLRERGTKMIMKSLGVDYDTARELLKKHGTVRKAIDNVCQKSRVLKKK